MTMPDHAQLLAEIEQGEALAQRAYKAQPGGWHVHHNPTRTGRADEWEIRDADNDSLAWVGTENDARLIEALASPDRALRRYAHYRRILDRHEQVDPWRSFCAYCREGVLWPCEDIRDLADALGLGTDHDH